MNDYSVVWQSQLASWYVGNPVWSKAGKEKLIRAGSSSQSLMCCVHSNSKPSLWKYSWVLSENIQKAKEF